MYHTLHICQNPTASMNLILSFLSSYIYVYGTSPFGEIIRRWINKLSCQSLMHRSVNEQFIRWSHWYFNLLVKFVRLFLLVSPFQVFASHKEPQRPGGTDLASCVFQSWSLCQVLVTTILITHRTTLNPGFNFAFCAVDRVSFRCKHSIACRISEGRRSLKLSSVICPCQLKKT
jgi:hypothetical protein